MMEALSFSETSVLTRATRRNIAEDAVLHLPDYTAQSKETKLCDVCVTVREEN
jgi:hypothetical protein